jgi:replicative DNA helicase
MSKKLIKLAKTPHFDEKTEQTLIGSILVSGTHKNEVMDAVTEIVDSAMFYFEKHQHIFYFMEILWRAEKEISPISIIDLAKLGEKDLTLDDLLKIVATSSLAASAKEAAQIIRRMDSERKILAICEDALEKAQTENHLESRLEEIKNTIEKFELKKDGVEIKSSKNMFKGFLAQKLETASKENFKPSILSGISQLDIENAIFKKGNLVTIAGRPGSGKTALAAILIDNFCQKNLNSLFFSLEMTEEQMTERMYAFKAQISPTVVQNYGLKGSEGSTRMHKEKLEMAEAYWENTTYQAVFNCKMDIFKLIRDIKIAYKKKPLDIVLIDQLSEITTGKLFNLKDTILIREYVVSNLKKLALELDIPIILLHQLSREADKRDNKIPQNSDLKDSGSVEEKSDMIWLLHKDEDKGNYKIFITKNRNGKISKVELKWDTKLARIIY